MRYAKGSISLHPIEDDRILRNVLRARFISHEQLWRLTNSDGTTTGTVTRSSFNWRVCRLVKHGLVHKQIVSATGENFIYSLRRYGLEYLAGRGECATDWAPRARDAEDTGVGYMLHALGLVDLHLRMRTAPEFVSWTWESEIRSRNEMTGLSYEKDYDAVVTLVRVDGAEARFALEYERMAKASRRYSEVRANFERDRFVGCFLYLTTHYNVLAFIAHHFLNTSVPVYFGLAQEFAREGLDMQVVDSHRTQRLSLRAAVFTPLSAEHCARFACSHSI